MRQLAHDYGVHRITFRIVSVVGVSTRQPGQPTEAELMAVTQYRSGWSRARLGEQFGCDAETVRQVLVRMGVRRRRP